MKPEDLLLLKEIDSWMQKALEADSMTRSDSCIEYGLSLLQNLIAENR